MIPSLIKIDAYNYINTRGLCDERKYKFLLFVLWKYVRRCIEILMRESPM